MYPQDSIGCPRNSLYYPRNYFMNIGLGVFLQMPDWVAGLSCYAFLGNCFVFCKDSIGKFIIAKTMNEIL